MLTERERQALVKAHDAATLQIKTTLTASAVASWRELPDHRDASVERFARQTARQAQAAAAKVARITDAYVSRALADKEPSPGIIDVTQLRSDVSPQDVYMRPANELWTGLGSGVAYDAAIDQSAARLASLIAMDLQLAKVQQFAKSTTGRPSASGGFRRVLTGRENCALCMIASTQRYRRGDLMPIHPGCDCGVEPLAPGENVGQVIDPDRLEATQNWIASVAGRSDRSARDLGFGKTVRYNTTGSDAAGNTRFALNERSADYTDLIAVRQHGEYGPTLSWRHHSFTGEADL